MREVPEWIGKNDDSEPPVRVQLRTFKRFNKVCQICFAPIISGPEFDHQVAICNGGSNSESNLVPVHPKCHKQKTRADVAEKSANYKTQLHHYGIRKPKRHRWGYGKDDDYKKKLTGELVPRQARN
jgi:5-methylcytosine-specific restriction protein A